MLVSFSRSSYLNQRGDSPGLQKGSQREREAFGDLLLRMSYEIRAQGVDAAALWLLSWCCVRCMARLRVLLVEGGGGSAGCWVGAEQEEALKWNTRLRRSGAVSHPETELFGHVPALAWRHGDIWQSLFRRGVLCL